MIYMGIVAVIIIALALIKYDTENDALFAMFVLGGMAMMIVMWANAFLI